MARRKQKSCHQCRTRHLKCDGEMPCLHCRRGARECSKDNDHIFLNESNIGIVRRKKKYSLSFDGNQKWIEVPASVQFAEPSNSGSSGTEAVTSRSTTPARTPRSTPRRSNSPQSVLSGATSHSSLQIDPLLQETCNDFAGSFPSSSASGLPETNEAPHTPAWLTSPIQWPFENYQEALLMQHYTDEMAPWFDTCDGARHFALTIPELATESSALLNAVFALSAKHLSLTGNLDPSVSLHYIDACYRALLPEVSTKAFEGDHLAAVLILRLVVQMTDPQEAAEEGNVFLGVDVFMAAWKANPSSSLHAELFLSVLRLYIHVSWCTKRPLPEAEGDYEWMLSALNSPEERGRIHNCKTTMHAAHCLNFAHDDKPKTWERWIELKRISDEWRFNKPKYFNPIFSQHSMEGDPFPKRLFASPVYAFTHQIASLARLLLLNNQPTTPPPTYLGASPLTARQIEDESLGLVRKIVGTSLSHSENSVMFIGTLAILYGGHLLRDTLSQEHAYNMLSRAQSECAGLIPPGDFTRLRRIWGWDIDDGIPYQNVL